MDRELLSGDTVMFLKGHPWEGKVGRFVGYVRLPIIGVRAKFRLNDGSGRETVARPDKWKRVQ